MNQPEPTPKPLFWIDISGFFKKIFGFLNPLTDVNPNDTCDDCEYLTLNHTDNFITARCTEYNAKLGIYIDLNLPQPDVSNIVRTQQCIDKGGFRAKF